MKESATEELIINTAKHIFFFKGDYHATTQDIADAAGINRALIHYYFRTREQLMEAVLKVAMTKMNERLYLITQSEVSFKEKISNLITIIIEGMLETPYLENFVVNEYNRLNLTCVANPHKELIESCLTGFLTEMQVEMQKGTIPTVEPLHFVINLLALCAYPISMRPLIQRTFGLEDDYYQQFIQDQKKIIYNIIFRETVE
jgi:AcrR family transcriptional regulator